MVFSLKTGGKQVANRSWRGARGVNFGFVVHCCAAGPGWVEQRPELFAEKLPMSLSEPFRTCF